MTGVKCQNLKRIYLGILTMINNLDIWNHADKIDPAYIKPDSNGGYDSFSLNGYWLIKKATELWGPIGSGWGYDILEDRFDEGATIWHGPSLKSDNPIALGKVITHTVKILLWYENKDRNSSRYSVTQYGHTPYVYQTKHGLKTDGEAHKKSLTDAIKKALSMLGFAGEVYLGEYDNPGYMQVVETEFEIQNAEQTSDVVQKKRNALILSVEDNIGLISTALTPNEANLIRKGILRKLVLQSKIPELKDVAERGVKAIEFEYTLRISLLTKDKESHNESSKAASV